MHVETKSLRRRFNQFSIASLSFRRRFDFHFSLCSLLSVTGITGLEHEFSPITMADRKRKTREKKREGDTHLHTCITPYFCVRLEVHSIMLRDKDGRYLQHWSVHAAVELGHHTKVRVAPSCLADYTHSPSPSWLRSMTLVTPRGAPAQT